jgi:CubicO group peptidase (beta-lactamase class C family)
MNLEALTADLTRELPALLKESDVPGLAVAICTPDEILWSFSTGVTRRGGAQKVTHDTIFSVQSCSKMFTSATVLIAVQQGLVDLDEPIKRYLPDFTVRSCFEPDPERKITLRKLLGHRAGFTHEAPEGNNYRVGRASFEAHCRSICETWLRFPVGHHYEYSNLGIDLAAYAVQCVAGVPFSEFARRHLFVPLGLQRTTFTYRAIATERNRAIGHSGTKRLPVRVPMVAAGGLYTSVIEACRFIQFHLSGGQGILDQTLLQSMYEDPSAELGDTAGYGLGTFIWVFNRTQARGHGGGGFGFICSMNWLQDAGIGVVVLSNAVDHNLPWHLTERILAGLAGPSMLSKEPDDYDSMPAHSISVQNLSEFAGQYVGRAAEVNFVVRGDRLLREGKEDEALRFVAPDVALLKTERGAIRYRFTRNGDQIQGLRRSDALYLYKNVLYDDSKMSSDPAWDARAGEYVLRSSGYRLGRVILRMQDGLPYIEFHEGPTLKLRQERPGLYFTPTGEALDLNRVPPTFGNIELHDPERS